MIFSHDFKKDIRRIDWFGSPFALARFGDGEMACIKGRDYTPFGHGIGTETWSGGRPIPLRSLLQEALEENADGYCVGIPPMCCQAKCLGEAMSHLRCPAERRVAATIFSYGNQNVFSTLAADLDLRNRSTLVSGHASADIRIPLDAINLKEWLDPTIDALMDVRGPILVAAGPAACILVHQYWMRANDRQVIVDIGSALDRETWGVATRMHTAGTDPHGMRFHECKIHGSDPCHVHCTPSRF